MKTALYPMHDKKFICLKGLDMEWKSSHILAVGLVVGATLWIASGSLTRDTAVQKQGETKLAPKLFSVSVVPVEVEAHSRVLTVSGRSEADRRTVLTVRANGTVTQINVRRGSRIKEGDVVAVLSDEAREANVNQASARVEQRRKEYEARLPLVAQGVMPRLNLAQYEADLKNAEAGLAAAEAERERGLVLAPIDGVITDLPVEIGQAMQPGGAIAEIVALDPMLVVIDVSERRIGGIKTGDLAQVRLANGVEGKGEVRFVSSRAATQTRTYRVDLSIANKDGMIPDGITAEVALKLAAVPASRIPRSALTFAADGQLGVRLVDAASVVQFMPVALVEDEGQFIWVSGLSDRANLIVQGQDFVKEGQRVIAHPAVKP